MLNASNRHFESNRTEEYYSDPSKKNNNQKDF